MFGIAHKYCSESGHDFNARGCCDQTTSAQTTLTYEETPPGGMLVTPVTMDTLLQKVQGLLTMFAMCSGGLLWI